MNVSANGEVVSLTAERRMREQTAEIIALQERIRLLEKHVGDRVVPKIERDRNTHGHEPQGACREAGRTVSMELPVVTCSGCGNELDALTVLREIALEEISFCYQLSSMRREHKALDSQITELKRQRAYLRRCVRADERRAGGGIVSEPQGDDETCPTQMTTER